MEQIFIDQLKELLEIDDREINLSDNFRSYPEWDSLASLSLVAMLDEEYGVVIPTEVFNKLSNIQALFDEVKKRLK